MGDSEMEIQIFLQVDRISKEMSALTEIRSDHNQYVSLIKGYFLDSIKNSQIITMQRLV